MEPVPKSTILLAYRHLYQHLLRAVKYSKPARYIARDRIRAAFRNSSPQQQHFQPAEISRTLEFLDNAAKYRGLEHRIVKNCMHVWWSRSPSSGDGMSPVYVHVTLLPCVTVYWFIHHSSFIIPLSRQCQIYQRIPPIIIILTRDFSHRKKEDLLMRRFAYTDFDETIRKLNETMGLCIK